MQKKHIMAFSGMMTGLVGAASVDRWPGHASPIQMFFYTFFVLAPLLSGFWSHRKRQNFWMGIFAVALLHLATLASIRSLFPFKTLLVVIPTAIMEWTIALTLFFKIVGY